MTAVRARIKASSNFSPGNNFPEGFGRGVTKSAGEGEGTECAAKLREANGSTAHENTLLDDVWTRASGAVQDAATSEHLQELVGVKRFRNLPTRIFEHFESTLRQQHLRSKQTF
jgi:hypothetical protein